MLHPIWLFRLFLVSWASNQTNDLKNRIGDLLLFFFMVLRVTRFSNKIVPLNGTSIIKWGCGSSWVRAHLKRRKKTHFFHFYIYYFHKASSFKVFITLRHIHEVYYTGVVALLQKNIYLNLCAFVSTISFANASCLLQIQKHLYVLITHYVRIWNIYD